MENILQDLIEISQFAAKHPDWVQGGGGNCSVKDGGKMCIKASGFFMEDVSSETGYVMIDPVSGNLLENRGPKASMEAPLHTLLGRFVIHTHPITAAALVSSKEGKSYFKTLFPDSRFIWIDYAAPGRELFEKVKSVISPEMIKTDLVLFLQNHGLFVSSALKQQAMDLHQQTIQRLEEFFEESADKSAIPPNHYLTPDHAVYTQNHTANLSTKQKTAYDETIFLVQRAVALISKKGWKPRWLSANEAAAVTNMDEEKYRQQIWGKA